MNSKNSFLLLFSILCCWFPVDSTAQLINGFGITGGATLSRQKWHDANLHTTEKKNYILGFNGSVFIEFFDDDFLRWISEIQFNQKGCLEKPPTGDSFKNKLNYLSFNNYLKIRYELFNGIPYLLIGPRIEYLLSQSTNSPAITGGFHKLNVSAAFGGGFEFIGYGPIKFFTEAFYNPDIGLNAYNKNDLQIKNRPWEVRLGLKFQRTNDKSSCPPIYKQTIIYSFSTCINLLLC